MATLWTGRCGNRDVENERSIGEGTFMDDILHEDSGRQQRGQIHTKPHSHTRREEAAWKKIVKAMTKAEREWEQASSPLK